MLVLKNIVKDYVTGDTTVRALKGVSINFRENEFVSILGPSGCGKTTMLNIVGGLDRYSDGDLVINGKSTKDFTDGDWDTYRNHSIGFVFQSYNLIPHQTVLSNVELALTLSGISKTERRKRAVQALDKVGLRTQMNKREEVSVTFQGTTAGGMVRRLFGKDGVDSTAEDTCEMYFQDASGAPADKTLKVELTRKVILALFRLVKIPADVGFNRIEARKF